MKTLASLVISAVVCSFSAHADTAFINEGVLTLPEVVVTGAEGARFYRDVKLVGNADGTFSRGSMQQLALASVQSISLDPVASNTAPVVVSLQGFKSPECVTFEPARVARDGNEFHVVLIEKEIPANVSCMAGQFHFLDYAVITTADLGSGDYIVKAHGLTLGFTVNDD